MSRNHRDRARDRIHYEAIDFTSLDISSTRDWED